MFHRLVARGRLFANVIVQMPLMLEDVRAGVEQQNLVDVSMNGVMADVKPVQVNLVQDGLHWQQECEVQTAQAREATSNATSERSKCDSICR